MRTESAYGLFFFFFNDTATTEIYTLSLHDALPISPGGSPTAATSAACRLVPRRAAGAVAAWSAWPARAASGSGGSDRSADRKSTRLNSSHANISYAVFCLKKKKNQVKITLLAQFLY